jgi:hypothetical protein
VTYITIDQGQAKLIEEADGRVEIRDSQGRHVGYVSHGFTPDEIAAARRSLDSDEPRHSFEQVLAQLRSLAPE